MKDSTKKPWYVQAAGALIAGAVVALVFACVLWAFVKVVTSIAGML